MPQSNLDAGPAAGPSNDAGAIVSAALATVAIAVPCLLAFNVPPSSTFLNQAAALIGWGAWLLMLAGSAGADASAGPFPRGLACLQVALALLLLAAFAAPLWAALPWSMALSAAAMIAAAALAAQVAAQAARGGLALPAFRAFCIGLVVAGVLCSAVGLVQVFAPGWADGSWIARSHIEGRAVGNMRQPNHLSSLLLWAIVHEPIVAALDVGHHAAVLQNARLRYCALMPAGCFHAARAASSRHALSGACRVPRCG